MNSTWMYINYYFIFVINLKFICYFHKNHKKYNSTWTFIINGNKAVCGSQGYLQYADYYFRSSSG
jgi:hypothetical protein